VDKDVEIAINLGNLKQVMRRANPNDMLTLEMDSSKLKITLKGTTTRTFNLPIIELEEKDQKVPELKFTATIKMPCTMFNDAIADADVVAESVAFVAEPKHFTILADGDLSQAKIEMAEDKSIHVTAHEKVKAKYSIEYLKKMIGGSKLSDVVEVHFGKDYPLRLDYKTLDKVMLSFILAPRVEND
jgi:proliferating cell nuclear antigen PCNA